MNKEKDLTIRLELEYPKEDPNPISELKTNETSWGTYHDETTMIPKSCPIRNVKKVDLGNFKMFVNLDNRLFEENFKDNTEG